MVRFNQCVAGILALLAVAGQSPALRAEPPKPPQTSAIGGHVLGLKAICNDCKPQLFATGFQDFVEGPVFDREGNLWVTGVLKGALWRITPDGHAAIGVQLPPEIKFPAGLRFAPDGTLYGVAMGSGLFSVDMATKKVSLVANGVYLHGLPDGAFRGLDDLFIDHAGGMYFTDAAGSGALRRIGQVLYRDPAGNISRLVPDGLAFPNGVVLSPDEKTLYISEWGSGEIIAAPLVSPGVVNMTMSYVFARLTGGHGPDSITADADGNIYAAHYGSKEVVVIAPNGDYFGAIQLPPEAGAEVTNVAIHNGYLYITESNKSSVWRVKTNIKGISLYGGS